MAQEKKLYRPGPLGSLMDEYERALGELKNLLGSLSENDYLRISNPSSPDPDCLSVHTIMRHVVSAGYGYAVSIRKSLGIEAERPGITEIPQNNVLTMLDDMFEYSL